MEILKSDQLLVKNVKWCKERCKEEALKYNTKPEFKKKSQYVYVVAYKNNWLDDICQHMKCKNKHNHWTKERCKEEALKYKNRKVFKENCSGAYSTILKNKWTDEMYKHMETLGNLYKRCIYVYEFSDNSVYIGLTYNINERHKQHLKDIKSTVYKYILSTNIEPKLIQLSDYIDKNEASKLEKETIEKYKKKKWYILNIAKGGGLGGNKNICTKEKCHNIALKYNTRSEMWRGNSHIYSIARKNKWLDDICTHMTEILKPKGYWTKDKCQQEALKYTNIKEFKKQSGGAFTVAYRNKWLDDICLHMDKKIILTEYWTKDKCYKESLKYKNKSELKRENSTVYIISKNNKWLDIFYNKQ